MRLTPIRTWRDVIASLLSITLRTLLHSAFQPTISARAHSHDSPEVAVECRHVIEACLQRYAQDTLVGPAKTHGRLVQSRAHQVLVRRHAYDLQKQTQKVILAGRGFICEIRQRKRLMRLSLDPAQDGGDP